jgi:PAS domain S-box-containing protein
LTHDVRPERDQSDRELAQLYRLQVRDLEDAAFFLITPDGVITTWNRGVEKIFGYTEQEWVGQNASLIFTAEDRAAGVPEIEMRAAAEQGRAMDVRWHERKDGTHVYLKGVMRSLRDEEGALIGFSKVVMDDTARKQLENALTQSNADLQQFAFIASHDLQEPLRTLAALSDVLTRRYSEQLDEEANKILGYMADAADRMTRLIRDLLAYSQSEREESRVSSVALDEDFESAVSMLRGSIEAACAVVTHDALPIVRADRNQMVRLLQNLVGNAVKFHKPDEHPRVHVSAERHGKEWMIRVTDNGIGFPPQEAENLFKPFRRLHRATDYPGSGIGLAACKRIVEGYGGRIGAESQVGQGATFWFTVPAADGD